MSTITKNNYFPSVDILRGFAAISVVIYHVIEIFEWKNFPITGSLIWFRSGWMGVDLFFVISGFVIALSAFSEIDKHGKDQFHKPFLRRRIFRIVPLYYFTCLVFMVFIVPSTLFERFLPNVLTHLFFIHNFIPSLHGGINGASWSLGTEMQFYFLVALIAPWLRITQWWKVAILFIGTAWIWRYGAQLVVPIDGPPGAFNLFVYSTQLPGMLDEFALGILLARLVRSDYSERMFVSKNLFENVLKFVVVFIIGFIAFSIYWKFASYWEFPYMVVFCRSLLGLFFVSLLYFACCLNNPTFVYLTGPIRYLGTISYGIYLWHLPVILSLKELPWLHAEKALPIVLLMTVLFAMVSWHFFEKPIVDRYSKAPVSLGPYFEKGLVFFSKFKFYLVFLIAALIIPTLAFKIYQAQQLKQRLALLAPITSSDENLNSKFDLFKEGAEFIPGGACNIDEVGVILNQSKTDFGVNRTQAASVSGWGVISVNDSAVGDSVKLMLTSENGTKYIASTARVERNDLVEYFNNPLIRNSGFKAHLLFSDVPQGKYKLFVLLAQNKRFIQCESSVTGYVK